MKWTLLLIILSLLIVSGCSEQNSMVANSTTAAEKATCLNAGGQWKNFSSVCQDKCGGQECIAMYQPGMGCDCGPDKCWDGFSCAPFPVTVNNTENLSAQNDFLELTIVLKEGVNITSFVDNLSLSKADFNITRIGLSGRWFSAEVNKSAIASLKSNPYVLSVSEPIEARIQNNQDTTVNEPPIYDWHIRFLIRANGIKQFDDAKQALLSLIQPEEYNLSSYRAGYTDLESTEGFRIDVTKKGYENIMSAALNTSQGLDSIYDLRLNYGGNVSFELLIYPDAQKMPSNETEVTKCDVDEDCIVQGPGCGCSTVNKAYAKYWNRLHYNEATCGSMNIPLICSGLLSKCLDGKCELLQDGFTGVRDALKDGETKTYTLYGKDYEVSVLKIIDASIATITVNGEGFVLTQGENHTLADGTIMTVLNVNYTSVEFQMQK